MGERVGLVCRRRQGGGGGSGDAGRARHSGASTAHDAQGGRRTEEYAGAPFSAGRCTPSRGASDVY